MTINELLKIDPEMQGLIDLAYHVRQEQHFNPQDHWAGDRGLFSFREAVVKTAGWYCDNPRLQSSEAYICWYQHIRGILFSSKSSVNEGVNHARKNNK